MSNAPARLQAHFSKIAPENHTDGWDAMWQERVTPWDRRQPSPALVETLNEHAAVIASASESKDGARRKRALVPGCGRGYDVSLFAAYGYDAYGLDVSPTALEAAKNEQSDANAANKYPVHNDLLGRGEAKFVLGNFFTDEFLAQTGGQQFDLIYDYTFLCALPRELRPKWSKRMSELLAPAGRLICLEFPLHKPPNTPGPPHGLSKELYAVLLKIPGHEVNYSEDGHVVLDGRMAPAEGALTRLDRWRPKQTHEVGKESDHVSVWAHQ
ncbi:S-adenosyl-L-methionine-dependent methyltransferase [Teratosphaeria nubilosa]|uniref:S-adenosyl-L-methionine-dependent methyltransferase n=1 Tax=Teratosphaeria nubilosa TaxID=161662 RepID=A0A6G1L952_9PEZI|nr:S-adenosyl-L-methionine-dependent methyltransferase [Teratosphaeria nubilosa]